MRLQFLSKLYKNKFNQILLSLACVILILLNLVLPIPGVNLFVERLDSFIYDQTLQLFHHEYQEKTRVVIVDIDDMSIYKEGRWPWPRDKLAQLLLKLQKNGVVITSFDVIMSDPEVNYAIGLKERIQNITNMSPTELTELASLLTKAIPAVDNNQIFANAMQSYDVVLGFLFHNLEDVRKGMLPPSLTNSQGQLLKADSYSAQIFRGYNASYKLFMEAAKHGGFASNLPDSDGIVRQGLILAGFENKVYPSLALMTVIRYLLAEHVDLKFHKDINGTNLYGIDVEGTFIPTNAHGQILIPFWGQPLTLPFYSATDILHDKVSANELQGAIAIIGSSTIMLSDLHRSPVAKSFPGVEMVGNMVAAMLNKQVATKYNWSSIEGIIYFSLFGMLFAFLIPALGVLSRILIALAAIGIILASQISVFTSNNLYIPAATLLTLILLQTILNYLYEFFLERQQKHQIKQLFGQYVPESYIKELLDAPEKSTMEGQTRDMTVLFSDIRSFTSTSEGLDAVGVKHLLNTFFTPITEIIYNHQGTIDKYVGDMVMAFWGAPIPIAGKGHAYQAITATLEIFKALPSINEVMRANNLPNVAIGIGLGTGLMNVGDMGSKFRRAYTVLGDVVNLASRLESLTKYYGVNVLVNDTTRENQDDFLWRTVDKVAVKGRQAALVIYEPLGLLTEMPPEVVQEVEAHHKALEAYFAQHWTVAKRLFEELKERHPNTLLYQLYINRSNAFIAEPPPEDWDGVYIHKEK
ncbi:MAG: CHASE2 domain-containing protein [Legionella sp.]|nr:CHASE2 domain-containing protein [Legionella sp.]